MTHLEQRQQAKRQSHVLATMSHVPFAIELAQAVWAAVHTGFPSTSLSTPSNPRTNDNPNTPYWRNGAIISTSLNPITVFGQALDIHFSMHISRDDWYKFAQTLPQDSQIHVYLQRPMCDGKPPHFQHSRSIDQLKAWELVLQEFLQRGHCSVRLEVSGYTKNQQNVV